MKNMFHRLTQLSQTGLAAVSVLLITVNAPAQSLQIEADTFQCIREMTPVRGFYVDNLYGADALADTLAVAESDSGGVYPPGSVVQLVPTEVMVKREAGFSAATRDWEFFELDVSADGTSIRARGTDEVVNRFGGNCLDCHIKARPEWDLVCEQTHGCDPIPLAPVMVKAIQKTDPRCAPTPLTEEEKQMVEAMQNFPS